MSLSNAVSSVVVQINGENITLESQDGITWTKTGIAPDASSYNLSGGYYQLTVTATYDTGSATTVSGTSDTTSATYDPVLSPQCRLVVKETYRPTINIIRPANNSYLKTASQTLEFDIVDNANGQTTGFSGINTSSLSVTIASQSLSVSNTYSWSNLSSYAQAITGGYKITMTDTFEDADDWTITVNVSDNDGNTANSASATFTIDTEAPALSVSSPIDNLKTSSSTVTISGTTSDTGSGQIVVSVTVNGADFGTISVGQGGAFSGTITLTSTGEKTIVITATDTAGNSTSVTKTLLYDDSAPTIRSVTMVPNPVDNGQTYIITVVTE